MKSIVKGAIREEKGSVFILVLILLVVGGLVLTPMLGLMSTGLMSGQVYERHAHRLYAADAGVEDAIWMIKYDPPETYPYHYLEPLIVDGKTVDVVIYRYDWDPTCGENLTYRILSTVITDDGGGTAAIVNSTTIDAHLVVSYLDLSSLLEHAIVSNGAVEIDVDLSGKSSVNGTIWLPDDDSENLKIGPNVQYDPDKIMDNDDVKVTWPTYQQLSAYYLEKVDGAPDPGTSIDIDITKTIGPCYRDGDLTIDNTGDPDTLVLQGTVYVAGNLEFQQAGSHNYTVDLNGNTIFVEGSITVASQQIRLSGSGCVIAKGDINCQPGIASEEGEFVLLMSLEGNVSVKPLAGFTGCIAGNGKVDLQPNSHIQWVSPEGKGLDFPMGVGDIDELPPVTGLRIESWEIS